ncbi:NAD-dependent epimerase/dehydratase family protein [Sphingobium algorifonticola]|uniref:NAD-dependent epimerase/dehydratase family protein n=1 Tax=Sphingobium algorifonticola TaxID=2008318 RepID=A0A437J785_9SPHN|nr:GDP-mannose 4,6-dehydratase [Sphingobium algorifonticola]RVT41022.1 NAD-dependent epimerase/dehydratase family protein [Sphingobium algorifonticola]
MMKTLITGISGFTGHYLSERLQRDGHEVHGIVREHGHAKDVPAHVVHVCDLLDYEALSGIISRVEPDYIVHLAAIAFVGHDDLQEMYLTNIIGTRTLLEVCARQPKIPQKILIASSANVYGKSNSGILNEDALIEPANDYGVTKLAVENIARIFSERLPIIVVRPFNYTGVGQSESFLIPKIIKHVRDRSPIIELGNLDVARDFSDVRSVVDAYARLLNASYAVNGVFNICSSNPVTLRELVALACNVGLHDMQIAINQAFVRVNEVPVLYGDKSRLESVIGPLDVPPLRDTLRWMIEA